MGEKIIVFDVEEVVSAGPAMRGGGRRGEGRGRQLVEYAVDVQVLSDNLTSFIESIRGMLSRVAEKGGEFEVEKVEVQAQIGGKGTVGFLGTGAEANASASLKIVLARRRADGVEAVD